MLLLSCSVVSLCDPMDCRTSGSSALQHLPEFAQTHVHWVGDAIYLILCYPLLLLPSIFASIRVFSKRWLFTSGGQSTGASASALILPVNIQGWFPLGLVQSPCCPRDSHKSSLAPQFESINSLALSRLYGPAPNQLPTSKISPLKQKKSSSPPSLIPRVKQVVEYHSSL